MATLPGELDITIVIPTYNRGRGVEENLAKWLALRPRAKEIILVDDHSDAETEAILRRLASDHGCVRYIRQPENGGQAVSRSAGFAAATGKYIVSLDDDSWLLEADGLQRVWDRMESKPTCGILAFNLFSPGLAITPAQDRLYVVADHLTCGAAYRAEILRATGYHLGFLRAGGEESDLSLKVRNAGYEVVQDLNVRGYHDYDPARRSRQALEEFCTYGVRNDLARALVYFPWPLLPLLLAWRIASHLRVGAVRGFLGPTWRGMRQFVMLLPAALRARKPVTLATAIRYLKLRRFPEVMAP